MLVCRRCRFDFCGPDWPISRFTSLLAQICRCLRSEGVCIRTEPTRFHFYMTIWGKNFHVVKQGQSNSTCSRYCVAYVLCCRCCKILNRKGRRVVTILFWNVLEKPNVLSHLSCLVQTHSVDVFILAECPEDLEPVIRSLNSFGVGTYREAVKEDVKVRALTRLGAKEFIHRYTSLGREMAVWTVQAPRLNPPEALIVGVHLVSKQGGMTEAGQALAAGKVIEELVKSEDRRKHRNTAIVGDFNMHPYDPGMTSVDVFHGLMTRELAKKQDRRYKGRKYRRFYNPMWGLFGDRTPGPAGSHYWRKSVPHNTHWQMFDQVLIRPSLIDHFDDLHILGHDGNHSLMGKDSAPDIKHLSDHLPVLFRLDI